MSSINKQQILDKISYIQFKNGQFLKNIISNLVIKNLDVGFSIDITGLNKDEGEQIRQIAIKEISLIEGIGKVTIALTSSINEAKPKYHIDNVKKIILVASGKGGVGKSTITSLLAEQLNTAGKRVGIVDADIYGPSIPQIFGLNNISPIIEDKKMLPLISRNIQIISIGILIQDKPVAWRGPMASKAIYQLLSLTKWDNLDYLIIDMPPGTGDIHISILENYLIDGALIITTPQKIAEIDVKKLIELYKKFNISILAIIENMSYFINNLNNEKVKVFPGSSGKDLAKLYNINFIQEIQLLPEISKACDNGKTLANLLELNLDFINKINN